MVDLFENGIFSTFCYPQSHAKCVQLHIYVSEYLEFNYLPNLMPDLAIDEEWLSNNTAALMHRYLHIIVLYGTILFLEICFCALVIHNVKNFLRGKTKNDELEF